VPVCVKDLRSFLGLADYYRKFVKHFGIISRPLTDLLKKNTMFQWTSDHDVAFNTLKTALVQAHVLSLPDFSETFYIKIDASDIGVGIVLMQEQHPIAFVSKALSPKMRGLSTYEKEYVPILLAVKPWRSYLQYSEFVIATDQKSLSYLNEQRLHTVWRQKVFNKLLGLYYKIVYKKRVDNMVTDALSKHPLHSAEDSVCCVVIESQPKWLDDIVDSYIGDDYA
jgi:hypothetical protein